MCPFIESRLPAGVTGAPKHRFSVCDCWGPQWQQYKLITWESLLIIITLIPTIALFPAHPCSALLALCPSTDTTWHVPTQRQVSLLHDTNVTFRGPKVTLPMPHSAPAGPKATFPSCLQQGPSAPTAHSSPVSAGSHSKTPPTETSHTNSRFWRKCGEILYSSHRQVMD